MSVLSDGQVSHGPTWAGFATRRYRAGGIGFPAVRCAMVQIFSIALVLFVLAHLQDRTLTILVALLGLAYAGIRATTIANVFAVRRMAAAWDSELSLLRRAALSAPAAETIAAPETSTQLSRLVCEARLEYAGLATIGAICLCYLLSSLIFGIAYQQLFM